MNPCGPLPTMLPMLSNESTGSSLPQLAQTLSSPAMPPPSNFSPFGPAPPAFVFDCMGPTTGSYIPVQISPRFQNPSPSPVPMVYATPSPLLMTPQQSTPSMTASDSTFFEVPPMVLSQSYSSTLAPPHATLVGGQQVIPFTISRTPERHPQQLPLSPNNSLTSPKTQIKFRERTPEAPFAGSQPAGYPPNYATTSNCYQQQRETTPEEEDFFSNAPKPGQRQKRYGYRSKQRKIDKVFKNIHVKTFEGLKDIKPALEEIDETFTITRIAAVFSKKNRFQKKGFIIYLRLGSVNEVERCQDLLQKWSTSLRNIAVAKKKERKEHQDTTISFPDDEFHHVRTRRFSATAL